MPTTHPAYLFVNLPLISVSCSCVAAQRMSVTGTHEAFQIYGRGNGVICFSDSKMRVVESFPGSGIQVVNARAAESFSCMRDDSEKSC
jgi:hypothetical protein